MSKLKEAIEKLIKKAEVETDLKRDPAEHSINEIIVYKAIELALTSSEWKVNHLTDTTPIKSTNASTTALTEKEEGDRGKVLNLIDGYNDNEIDEELEEACKKIQSEYRNEVDFINNLYGLTDLDHITALDIGHFYYAMRHFQSPPPEEEIKLLELAAFELKAMYKRLGIINSNLLIQITEYLNQLTKTK